MHLLVGTDSVHTTAAICDHLESRASAATRATVLAVASPDDGTTERDAADALNVARVRLSALGSLETDVREGDPAEVLLDAAERHEADEIVVGSRRGNPAATAALGSTTRTILAGATRPVVVVPIPAF